jgi:4-hydroxythreonine-4-phosphate dehydrogenase
VAAVARQDHACELVAVGDPSMLAARAEATGRPLALEPFDAEAEPAPHEAGRLRVLGVPLATESVAGRLDPRNAAGVIAALDTAASGCISGTFDALVTAPIHKGTINDAGIPFSGHTERLAELCGGGRPVMMLMAGPLRVALATTHLPLRAVPDAIRTDALTEIIEVLYSDLRTRFGFDSPRIAVLGLNPHAGEGGHLGREELEVIVPALDALRAKGLELRGPLPADTAFAPHELARSDAVLAMYHDQGLPVLKHAGFGSAVNVTLGLPIVRTSVDHGTALDIAGRGTADPGSLRAALAVAYELAIRDGEARNPVPPRRGERPG